MFLWNGSNFYSLFVISLKNLTFNNIWKKIIIKSSQKILCLLKATLSVSLVFLLILQTPTLIGKNKQPDLNKLKYDYNQVLHYSLLFYEAQRSGKILPDTRIGFRGDSGLKDGCDVGIDLSKGYYDGQFLTENIIGYNFFYAMTKKKSANFFFIIFYVITEVLS